MSEVYIYGAGNMGKAVYQMAKAKGETVLGMIDKNKARRGEVIEGVTVHCPDDIPEYVKPHIKLVVAISAVPYHVIESELKRTGFHRIMNSGDYLNGIGYRNLVNIWTIDEIVSDQCRENINGFFDDELSYVHYNAAIGWFEKREESIEDELLTNWNREKYFPERIRKLIKQSDGMVDVSLLSGEYVKAFYRIATSGCVTAFNLHPSSLEISEIDSLKKEFSTLNVIDMELGEVEKKDVKNRTGIMEPFTTEKEIEISTIPLDMYEGNIKCDFFRGYSMSPILPILAGASKTIGKFCPILALNIGHYKRDFIDCIPYLRRLCLDYSFTFRMHSFQGNDCILYAIPLEKNTI